MRKADKEANAAKKAAGQAEDMAKRALDLASKCELAAAEAFEKEAAAIKAIAKSSCAEFEFSRSAQAHEPAAPPDMATRRHLAKLARDAETAGASAEAAVAKVAALVVRAKAATDAALDQAERVAGAVTRTELAAKNAEAAIRKKYAEGGQASAKGDVTAGADDTASETPKNAKPVPGAPANEAEATAASVQSAAASGAQAEQAALHAKDAAERIARSKAETGMNLKAPKLYLNRELTWLEFNKRVLNEAADKRTPLLERVKFLAIVGGNLDEFFMKRIGGLKQQVGAGIQDLTIDGRSPRDQVNESIAMVRGIQAEARQIFLDIKSELMVHGIAITDYASLPEDEKARVRTYYLENIFPLVTPLAMDPAHPFPHISNLSLNLLVTLRTRGEATPIMARVKVPTGNSIPRFVPVGPINKYVLLEDVMANNLDVLFPDVEVMTCEAFRVTRNANTEREEDAADDLLEMIESEVRDRKFAPIVRLETIAGIDPIHRGMLAAELGLDEEQDVFESDVMLGMRDLFEIASINSVELHDPDHHGVDAVELEGEQNIFHAIRNKGPFLLSHPYQSFNTSVVRFVREACRDPKVMAIKMTLYRTTEGTGIVDLLIEAARNGKQVAVVVELKARFDEAANINWAGRLEEAGIHVTYGIVGLKTHSKLVLVIRRDFNGLRRYAHIGTGNYHAGTARMYVDFGLLTCDPEIGFDLVEFFNFLTSGCQPHRRYSKILVSPRNMKDRLLDKINREISISSARSRGLIRLKTNALEDPDIAEALYRASRVGVKIELIVRDTCRVRPGIPKISENITVVSVVGRFLEHARIYYFQNGGNEEFYIGSADLMMRNLESRAEVIVAVEDEFARDRLREFLEGQLNDRRNVWDMDSEGRYTQRQSLDENPSRGCQQAMIEAAERRFQDARRKKLMRPRAIARRATR